MDRIIISFDINDKDELPSFYKKEPPKPTKPEQSEQVKTPRELYVIQYKLNNAEKMKEYAKEYYKNYAKVYYQQKKLNKILEKEKEARQNKELVTTLWE